MTTLIICSSRSPHANTTRIAQTIAETIDAQVVTPDQATPELIAAADRIGFGSGIYWMNFDRRLIDLVDHLADGAGREAFVFATSGLPETPLRRYTESFRKRLEHKGFRVIDTFTCRGLDTMGPLAAIGGLNKQRPNQADLDAARRFALQLP
ncbi:flavodoxin family protein [Jongsikchunia kroppenstedtii]|uniref:flavodoxin family protein n=1 Tax=Jongsikchunia kroppenstedtii TaxID=1121721 RepID=UPI00035EA9CD|nr:flavodoxin family protein [Jongsikchunia kroppenstedtii]